MSLTSASLSFHCIRLRRLNTITKIVGHSVCDQASPQESSRHVSLGIVNPASSWHHVKQIPQRLTRGTISHHSGKRRKMQFKKTALGFGGIWVGFRITVPSFRVGYSRTVDANSNISILKQSLDECGNFWHVSVKQCGSRHLDHRISSSSSCPPFSNRARKTGTSLAKPADRSNLRAPHPLQGGRVESGFCKCILWVS